MTCKSLALEIYPSSVFWSMTTLPGAIGISTPNWIVVLALCTIQRIYEQNRIWMCSLLYRWDRISQPLIISHGLTIVISESNQ